MDISINKRLSKRLRHHLLIALAMLIFAALLYLFLFHFYPENERWFFRWSMTTGYIAAILLAATLTLGALNILRERVNPVSSDLRRDTGIWCAIISFIHIAFGLNVHLKNWTQYFIDDAGKWRTDAFGFANYLGVLAGLALIALLLTSNDYSLRLLGRGRWKFFQRWNYFFVFIVALHGFLYQFVEKRLTPYSYFLAAGILWILAFQISGFIKKRKQLVPAKLSTE